MPILDKGLVQIYTGEGKGKTTAAFGLAWRMLGRGGKVYICQFLKPASQKTGETILAERFKDSLTLDRLDLEWNLKTSAEDPRERQRMNEAIMEMLRSVKVLAKQGGYDLIILDEILVCISLGLVSVESVLELLRQRAAHVEIVMTGRGAPSDLLVQADLVTEMKAVKHPYENGLIARKGIEY